MIYRQLPWDSVEGVAGAIRAWFGRAVESVDPVPIGEALRRDGDVALRELTARHDATATDPDDLEIRVPLDVARQALAECEPAVVSALRVAIDNVNRVAIAQLHEGPKAVRLPQGHTVTLNEVAVGAAGIYAPGGRAAYPSTVVMGCVTARAAEVERVVLASPPGPDGRLNPTTLAAAALCEVDEIYAIGGAQAIYALARGTGTIEPVDVIAGPGNAWVQAAKKDVFGEVGIDSLAGPSDLTVVLDDTVNPVWAAHDLCAQAEHGAESPLVAIASGPGVLEPLMAAVDRVAADNPSVNECRLALAEAPGAERAVALADALAPEHLQLMSRSLAGLAGRVRTAGCVFTGPESGTAFGDYIAGSNHVLPTDGTGRFFGPLSPAAFRRPTAQVNLTADAVTELAGPMRILAEREGLPVHGKSGTVRSEKTEPDRGDQ